MTRDVKGATPGLSIRFWGVRGSIPVSGGDYVRFGGDTICFEVKLGDERFIVDAGSGLRRLGGAMVEDGDMNATLLLTHFHLDHIIGLTGFEVLRSPAARIQIHAPAFGSCDVRSCLARLLGEPFFPVALDRMRGIRACSDFELGTTLAIGCHRIRTVRLNHGGGACGYRFDHAGKALAIITDHEHRDAAHEEALADFCQGADLIVYDAMWDESVDYDPHRGWGHSSWQAGLRLLRKANARRLACVHHAPTHTDDMLEHREEELQRQHASSFCARQDLYVVL
ncbi:MBL fold metallo-hydrolase [uncultured Bosea sp.]|uniref:MBL fold metallo-hydrolase n=1 Tax=uncultured Bosea sp. TaxID=211457 RepID=UPI00263AC076|nr:MBL fold metallo-hydrolase [uncultured Bosea sp.]